MKRLDQLLPAMRDLIRATDALADAEHRGAQHPDVIPLADVVIAARVEVAKRLVTIGWEPPPGVRAALERDTRLVNEPSDALDSRP